MQKQVSPLKCLLVALALLVGMLWSCGVFAQDEDMTMPGEEEEPPEEIVPPITAPGETAPPAESTGPATLIPRPTIAPGVTPAPGVPPTEGTPPAEGETRWTVKINAAIRAHYVFNDSPDNFVVKYRWEIKGQANANTAVIRGDAEISADVEGFLSKWPTGQCKLEVGIPKVPFELTFQKSGEDRGSIALQFRRAITEDWQSKCTFTDSGTPFNTVGPPETLLAKAIDKARPPLRSIITDIKKEETTTTFIISKEVIDDPPLGTIEIEGTGVVTITPGGGT